MTATASTQTKIEYRTFPNLKLDAGVVLPEATIAFRQYGQRHNAEGGRNKVVLVSTCFGEMVSDTSVSTYFGRRFSSS